MKIRKAVLPVAGMGTRFLPITKVVPKELLPIVDKPVIQYLVEEAVKSGIEEVIFVISKEKELIRKYFSHHPELEESLLLKGKHKPMYTPHIDTGDHVVVINASKVVLTGRKPQDKRYFHHTLYPGGASWTSIRVVMEKHPERVLMRAVHGMMPKTNLGRAMEKKLKVYAGPEHPHEAQQPVLWNPE